MRYRKKPVEIEAFPWTYGCSIPGWAKGKLKEFKDYVLIDTLEGKMRASPGDYIICGVEGEVYSCRSDIFEKTYELVEVGSSAEMNEQKNERTKVS